MTGSVNINNASAHYGSVANANDYFSHRSAHLEDWSGHTPEAKRRALVDATRAIDLLRFRSNKSEPAQVLEFPRGGSADIPEDIVIACYEEAQSLLSGKNPDIELENLMLTSDGAGSVRASFNRQPLPPQHLANGITSATAWAYLRPFLRHVNTFEIFPG